jgi:hypothetical protein
MKRRHGFVSNSSSSSFVIQRDDVTSNQVILIRDHSAHGAKLGLDYPEDAWDIEVTDSEVRGSTIMDNFDMGEFLRKIDVPDKVVTWAEY